MILLAQLILAHLLGDFFLQPAKWIMDRNSRKWRSPYLYFHAGIHFLLTMLITWNDRLWKEALIIMCTHLLIDGIKAQFQQTSTQRVWFFIDQFAHIAVIIAICLSFDNIRWAQIVIANPKLLIISTGIVFVLKPASLFTKNAISKWTPDTNNNSGQIQSLQDAGEWIGYLERLMILIFVLLGRWEGVGFLLAAKSVFRFGDLKEPKETKLTEYVVIGTFLSFFIAITTGIITCQILKYL